MRRAIPAPRTQRNPRARGGELNEAAAERCITNRFFFLSFFPSFFSGRWQRRATRKHVEVCANSPISAGSGDLSPPLSLFTLIRRVIIYYALLGGYATCHRFLFICFVAAIVVVVVAVAVAVAVAVVVVVVVDVWRLCVERKERKVGNG